MLTCATTTPANAQTFYPTDSTTTVRCNALIEIGKAYISGVCILKKEKTIIKGIIFNEFGITALSFIYDEQRDKVKLEDAIGPLRKWYIKRIIKKDLRTWFKQLKNGNNTYVNKRRNIVYTISAFNEDDYGTEE